MKKFLAIASTAGVASSVVPGIAKDVASTREGLAQPTRGLRNMPRLSRVAQWKSSLHDLERCWFDSSHGNNGVVPGALGL